MSVWYFKEENMLRFWRLCGRIEKTRRKATAVTLQQLRYVTAVAGTISHAVQQFYISQPSLTNAIRELEQEVRLALSKTASSVVSRTLLEYLRSTRQRKVGGQHKTDVVFFLECACYPYSFPTIFPRAAAGRSLHKRRRNLYCAPAT